jgi:gliding motility-associated-like protein
MVIFKHYKFEFFLTCTILLISLKSYSQSAEYEDCIGAIPVCQSIYVEETPYLYYGEGNYSNEIYQDGYTQCFTDENNGVWYVFSAQATGFLKFTIFPTNPVDDFDWTVIDITDISCPEIYNHTEKYISSNTWGDLYYNGNTGANSDSLGYGTCNGPGFEFGPPFNQDIPIDKNDTYVLYISNFSDSQNGYTLDFSASTVSIFDNQAPIASIAPDFLPKCDVNEIKIFFNEYVKCESVTPNVFSLSGGINIVDVISEQCDIGSNTDNYFTLILDQPIIPDSYSLTINSNILDNCGNLAPLQTLTFDLVKPAILDSDLILDCDTGNYNLTITPNATISDFTYTEIFSGIYTEFSDNIFNNLSSGNYSFYITSNTSNCKSDEINLSLEPYIPILATVDSTEKVCFGENTGTININASGGNGILLYSIDNGINYSNNFVFNNLIAGNYIINIKDNLNCIKNMGSYAITEYEKININQAISHVNCFGDSTGGINLLISGGSFPYSVIWSNGETSETLINLYNGVYKAIISDINNCKDSVEITIVQPEPLLDNYILENVTCNGGFNGKIDLSIEGGVHPYSYLWNNGENTQDIDSLYAGIYNVVVTDYNNCKKELSFELTQPYDFVAQIVKNDVTCYGLSNGNLNLNTFGGLPPYQFLWNTGDTLQNLENLAFGYYMVTIIDQTGLKCAVVEAVIAQPDSLFLDFNTVDITCFNAQNGYINGSVKGGTPEYNILITDDFGNYYYDFRGLGKGNYYINITDKNNCRYQTSASINEPEPFNIKANINNNCLPEGNGSVELLVSGATPPYSYLWDNDLKTESIFNLLSGIYSLILKDINDCTLNLQFVVEDDYCPPNVELSNIFTPNNDNKNDLFFINTKFVESYVATIYNRWGDKIFEWNELSDGWNGENQKTNKEFPEGVYFCIVRATGINGEIIEVSGSVSLYR